MKKIFLFLLVLFFVSGSGFVNAKQLAEQLVNLTVKGEKDSIASSSPSCQDCDDVDVVKDVEGANIKIDISNKERNVNVDIEVKNDELMIREGGRTVGAGQIISSEEKMKSGEEIMNASSEMGKVKSQENFKKEEGRYFKKFESRAEDIPGVKEKMDEVKSVLKRSIKDCDENCESELEKISGNITYALREGGWSLDDDKVNNINVNDFSDVKVSVKRVIEKRFLGIFKIKVEESGVLDDRGEIDTIKRPWWSFLAW